MQILQYFRASLSYHLSLRSLFSLFLSGRFTQEHSAILSTFIELPFSIKSFVLSILSGRLRRVLLYMLRSDPYLIVSRCIYWLQALIRILLSVCL